MYAPSLRMATNRLPNRLRAVSWRLPASLPASGCQRQAKCINRWLAQPNFWGVINLASTWRHLTSQSDSIKSITQIWFHGTSPENLAEMRASKVHDHIKLRTVVGRACFFKRHQQAFVLIYQIFSSKVRLHGPISLTSL